MTTLRPSRRETPRRSLRSPLMKGRRPGSEAEATAMRTRSLPQISDPGRSPKKTLWPRIPCARTRCMDDTACGACRASHQLSAIRPSCGDSDHCVLTEGSVPGTCAVTSERIARRKDAGRKSGKPETRESLRPTRGLSG